MKLRIISGTLKGRYISLGGGINYRPTQERVRESVAEMLKARVRGAVAADVCAGSGAYGFEMLSRGAARVDFVEADRRAALLIGENAAALGVGGRARVVREDAETFAGKPPPGGARRAIPGGESPFSDEAAEPRRCVNGACEKHFKFSGGNGLYDIIFYDPPYGDAGLSALVPALFGLLRPGGLLVYERRRTPAEKKNADTAGKAGLLDVRLYSDTAVEFYGREEDADSDISGDV